MQSNQKQVGENDLVRVRASWRDSLISKLQDEYRLGAQQQQQRDCSHLQCQTACSGLPGQPIST